MIDLREIRARPLLVASLALAVGGCLSVPSVAGRTAAVVPEGREFLVMGGGVASTGYEDVSTGETGTDLTAVPHFSLMLGLGDGFDCQFGANGFQGIVVVRYQLAGEPLSDTPPSSRGMDVSIEAGTSVSSSATVARLEIGPADFHLGLNVSFPGGNVVPYVTYRHHWANGSYWKWEEWFNLDRWIDPDTLEPHLPSWPSGVEESEDFEQEMIFVGVEFPSPGGGASRVAIEIFHGRPSFLGAEGTKKTGKVYGLNVIFSRF